LDRSNKDWRRAFVYLLNAVKKVAEKEETNLLLLRDFKSDDLEIHDFLTEQGFLKTAIPNNHTITPSNFDNIDDFLGKLNHSQRQYIKQKALRNESLFKVSILNKCCGEEIEIYKTLFENVRRRNYEINTFALPDKFLEELNSYPNWEIIQLQLSDKTVAAMLCFKNRGKYFPIFVGLDYQYLNNFNIYAQILWQTIKRAIQLKSNIIQLGLTASQNKRKFGAVTTQQVVYAQLKDNLNANIISLMANKRRA
jgi:predicted N-acyltransferase